LPPGRNPFIGPIVKGTRVRFENDERFVRAGLRTARRDAQMYTFFTCGVSAGFRYSRGGVTFRGHDDGGVFLKIFSLR